MGSNPYRFLPPAPKVRGAHKLSQSSNATGVSVRENISATPEEKARKVKAARKITGSDRCPCGAELEPEQTICEPCYKAIPGRMRRALYFPVGKGFKTCFTRISRYIRMSKKRAAQKEGA